MVRTTFIAITGSLGKTTAKECLAAIVSNQGPSVATIGNDNGRHGLPRTILRVRPWHRYAVLEVGTDRPGYMVRSALLIRPDITVILAVAPTHTQEFRTLEDTAAEKAQLLRFLPRNGVAVLNADDPRVSAMGKHLRCRVVRFGSSPGCELRVEDSRSVWPERLAFRAVSPEESVAVRTQLVGTHWVPSVLGALAVARACGISLAAAAAAIQGVPAFPARMQPVELPSGATILRDEYNGSFHSMAPAFLVLKEARAARKGMVISDYSDSGQNYRHRMRYLAKQAAETAAFAVFIGPKSDFAAKQALREGMPAANVHDFEFAREAAEFLKTALREGDLVLLKGRLSDHLSRVYFAQIKTVSCWISSCPVRVHCDVCPRLRAEQR